MVAYETKWMPAGHIWAMNMLATRSIILQILKKASRLLEKKLQPWM
jgi:hypothetical protein